MTGIFSPILSARADRYYIGIPQLGLTSPGDSNGQSHGYAVILLAENLNRPGAADKGGAPGHVQCRSKGLSGNHFIDSGILDLALNCE